MMRSRPKGSGFEAPAIGTMLPEGSTIRKNPDGTITIVPPGNAGNNRRTGGKHGKEKGMSKKIYFTLTGTKYYYGNDFLKPGMKVKLIKEPENDYDVEAIRVELPGLGKVGYVANSTNTVIGESLSAGRIYDRIGKKADGKVKLVTERGVLCRLSKKD